jgi:hypothetical protein
VHVAKLDAAPAPLQFGGGRPIRDVALLIKQLEHAFHIDQGLLDFAVDDAKEI